jgi:hypothetical protein
MILQKWGDTLVMSFQNLWGGIIEFIPNLVIAIVIFLAGWVVGSLLGNVVSRVVRSLKIDDALASAGIGSLLHRAGMKLDAGKFLGMLVEWFVVVVFLIAAFDVLGLTAVNQFLTEVVVTYLPQVIVAALILVVAGVVAEASQKVVSGSARAAGLRSANLAGSVTRWSVWTFAIIISLSQLGIATVYLQTLFTGVVVALSIAAGLAFGLGGQDAAAQVIDKVRREIAEHNHQ